MRYPMFSGGEKNRSFLFSYYQPYNSIDALYGSLFLASNNSYEVSGRWFAF